MPDTLAEDDTYAGVAGVIDCTFEDASVCVGKVDNNSLVIFQQLARNVMDITVAARDFKGFLVAGCDEP